MLTDDQVKKIVSQNEFLSSDDLAEAEKAAKKNNKDLAVYLFEKKLLKIDSFYQAWAVLAKIPYIDFKNQTIRKDIDPDNIQIAEFLQKKLDQNILVHLATPASIEYALNQYHQNLEAEFKNLTKPQEQLETTGDLKSLAEDLPIVRIVESLLEYAVFESASDIHIEPLEKEVIVRYRIDGLLKTMMTLPKTVQAGLVARIKILANLKLDEHRMPQDGRFKIKSDQYQVAFRVSILPVYDGEKIVMRLLNEGGQSLSLEDLGLQAKPLELIKTNISKPYGMILVTGPTGSGKTTTLYTLMNLLNKPEINISTIEDPIEYRIPHINQSQVNPKIDFTFANGLRAVLRQDPNIIMVGEIRDKETAEICINAALTGHLVLSTVHTNNAVSTAQRLINMGVEPFLITNTTNLIIAQRLVRKLCKNCITSYNLDKEVVAELQKHFNIADIFQFLVNQGLVAKDTPDFDKLLFYRGKGCKLCHNEGYKGRVGIYELLKKKKKI
ncbi:MAG: GspE/PulE family protein, partial [Candidatus Komeilibacteria bacterium]|nr:GspE/PulE family protein [Candidatus Komeilibacteria bacterium]